MNLKKMICFMLLISSSVLMSCGGGSSGTVLFQEDFNSQGNWVFATNPTDDCVGNTASISSGILDLNAYTAYPLGIPSENCTLITGAKANASLIIQNPVQLPQNTHLHVRIETDKIHCDVPGDFYIDMNYGTTHLRINLDRPNFLDMNGTNDFTVNNTIIEIDFGATTTLFVNNVQKTLPDPLVTISTNTVPAFDITFVTTANPSLDDMGPQPQVLIKVDSVKLTAVY